MSLLSVLTSVENREKTIASPLVKEKKLEAIDLLRFSKNSYSLGMLIPGQIIEELFIITNPSPESIELQMSIECENKEFDDLDEYVFTIRSADSNSYHHRHKTYFSPFSKAHFRIALKVPPVKDTTKLSGSINLSALFDKSDEKSDSENSAPDNSNPLPSIPSLQSPSSQTLTKSIPILANVSLPSIKCTKTLTFSTNSPNSLNSPLETIKLAAKKGRKVDLKIPFKNLTSSSICFSTELFSPIPLEEGLIVVVNGNGGIMTGNNGLSLVSLSVRAPLYVEQKYVKQVLLLKVRGSDVIFSFPLVIELY